MKPYHKIETLLVRDEKTHKVIRDQWRTPEFALLSNLNWLWYEKLDGTNIRVKWDGERVTFGGRTERAQIPTHLLDALQETFTPERFAAAFDGPPVCLYGEGVGPKIQKVGGMYGDKPTFILFDVLVRAQMNGEESDVWLRQSDVADVADKMGIGCAPSVGNGSLLAAIDFVERGEIKSTYAPDRIPEGLILRPPHDLFNRMGHRIIGKIKHGDFAQ